MLRDNGADLIRERYSNSASDVLSIEHIFTLRSKAWSISQKRRVSVSHRAKHRNSLNPYTLHPADDLKITRVGGTHGNLVREICFPCPEEISDGEVRSCATLPIYERSFRGPSRSYAIDNSCSVIRYLGYRGNGILLRGQALRGNVKTDSLANALSWKTYF